LSKPKDSNKDELAKAVTSTLSEANLASYDKLIALVRDGWLEAKQKKSAMDELADSIINEELAN